MEDENAIRNQTEKCERYCLSFIGERYNNAARLPVEHRMSHQQVEPQKRRQSLSRNPKRKIRANGGQLGVGAGMTRVKAKSDRKTKKGGNDPALVIYEINSGG